MSSYSVRVFKSIDETDMADWNRVHKAAGDVFSDPRFLRTMERTMGNEAPCKPVIFYDESETAVAISTMSSCSLDVVQLASPWIRKAIGWIRRLWSGYLRFNIVMCGPAAMILQDRLFIVDGADRTEVLRLLDEVLCDFAAERRSRIIMAGDFDTSDMHWLDELRDLGYVSGDSLPTYSLKLPYDSFDHYLSSMRSQPRYTIRKDKRAFQSSSVEVEHLSGGEQSAQLLTGKFYEFYLHLIEQAGIAMNTLSLEYFQELIRVFPEETHFMRILIDGKPAAFMLSLTWKGTYHLLFGAYDRKASEHLHVYFNTFYETIVYTIDQRYDAIELGATSDLFKLRLGGTHRGRTIYVKVLGILRYPFRLFSRLLLPPMPPPEVRRIFVQHPRVQDPTGSVLPKSDCKEK